MTLVLAGLVAALVLVSGGALAAVFVVHQRSLAHVETQRVIGGLPPKEWADHHTLEQRRVAIEERRLAIQEAQAQVARDRETAIYEIEIERRKIDLANAKTAALERAERMSHGGAHFFGS